MEVCLSNEHVCASIKIIHLETALELHIGILEVFLETASSKAEVSTAALQSSYYTWRQKWSYKTLWRYIWWHLS